MTVRKLNIIDPFAQQAKVLPRVYNDTTNQRLVRRIREGRSYGGSTTIDVIGCNMLCSYCYVDDSFLTGLGGSKSMLAREKKQGKVRPFTPKELASEVTRTIEEKGWPSNIQITAAEPFITPDWLIELIEKLAPHARNNKSFIWVDTNGVNIVQNPEIIKRLKPFGDVLRIFVSSKNAPKFYAQTTKVDKTHANTGFQCIDMLWENEMSSYLQAISALFFLETFDWYTGRLEKLHEAAPLLLDLDRLSYLPLPRIRSGLKSTGLWDIRQRDVETEKAWKAHLETHYGRTVNRLLSVDYHVEDEALVRNHIFNGTPIEECYLFEPKDS
ncbi:MAG: radical SAM protein [Candidatus Melainabacteria bacterium]|nr:radical SAM protein [Candidatus Melainabacteria bacterium]